MDVALLAREPEEAVIWLRKAAEGGDSEAQHELGAWYENGDAGECNHSEAFNWYLRAAESGYSLAIWSVGRMYAQGRGVARNGKKALSWFMRLADPRTTEDPSYMPWAQWSIGEMYSEGLAVAQDRSEAYKWLALAGAYGEQRPEYLSRLLAKTMRSEELTESKKRFDHAFVKRIGAGAKRSVSRDLAGPVGP